MRWGLFLYKHQAFQNHRPKQTADGRCFVLKLIIYGLGRFNPTSDRMLASLKSGVSKFA